MSKGEILQAAPYHLLLDSSVEFQDLVHAHKETAGSERLAEVTSSGKRGTSHGEIKNLYVENQKRVPKEGQLIKQEDKETEDIGLTPCLQYLNQDKGYMFFALAGISHIIFVAGKIWQNSWMVAGVENPRVSALKFIAVYLLIGFVSMLFSLSRSLSVVSPRVRAA